MLLTISCQHLVRLLHPSICDRQQVPQLPGFHGDPYQRTRVLASLNEHRTRVAVGGTEPRMLIEPNEEERRPAVLLEGRTVESP